MVEKHFLVSSPPECNHPTSLAIPPLPPGPFTPPLPPGAPAPTGRRCCPGLDPDLPPLVTVPHLPCRPPSLAPAPLTGALELFHHPASASPHPAPSGLHCSGRAEERDDGRRKNGVQPLSLWRQADSPCLSPAGGPAGHVFFLRTHSSLASKPPLPVGFPSIVSAGFCCGFWLVFPLLTPKVLGQVP